jgi:hypothetical protein
VRVEAPDGEATVSATRASLWGHGSAGRPLSTAPPDRDAREPSHCAAVSYQATELSRGRDDHRRSRPQRVRLTQQVSTIPT